MKTGKKSDLHKMIGLDIFLNSLSYEEYKKTEQQLIQTTNNRLPLISGDIFMQHISNIPVKKDTIELLKFSKQYKWHNNIPSILKGKNYDALVLTDISKKIHWVNDGFSKMTGYKKEFALNKTPKILQGKDTLESTKERIREKIALNKPFKEVILNYKKDNTPYKCEVSIFPLYTNKKETTHFLALEREVV